MTGDRKLELNTLSRYRKVSPSLILEEHSHCEVPAGCGGVVLRWIDPREGLPLTFRTHAPAPVHLFLDGAPLESARPTVPRGRHVLAIHVERSAQTAGLMLSATYDPPSPEPAAEYRRSRRETPRVRLVSSLDGSWRGTNVEPVDELWTSPSFDAETEPSWRPVDRVSIATPARREPGSWAYEKLAEFKPTAIGIPGSNGALWLRYTFVLEPDSYDLDDSGHGAPEDEGERGGGEPR